ncbi:secreted RxLR effector protein 161-like [Malus sylvestris]|uniref:secreted RxLR effector protein 161-like n=1 Tax=Malus sylvestris TaxID=3752 RepID=UPI0021AD3B6A|nr:secreted RxLR effector protein 161-like [Malus sylvestris]
MAKCSSGELPIGKGDKLSKEQCPKNELEKETMKDKPYASFVGSLMYAHIFTRLNLAFGMSVLGRFQSNPVEAHRVIAKKVLWYLRMTRDYMLVYNCVQNMEMIAYTYSDMAGCVDDRKSRSGYMFILAGGAISWKSTKQKATASSTMEAEFISYYTASKQAICIKNMMKCLRVIDYIEKPLKVYCDNKAAVFFSKNKRCRLIDIKYLQVKDEVKSGMVEIEHIGTTLMIADPLTKALPVGVFKRHVFNMGVQEPFDSINE